MNANFTLKRLARALEPLAWAAFFALALAFLGLRYWLLPDVERYREAIVQRVAAAVGQRVSIGRIDAAWPGLRPTIKLRDVRIYDADGREALRLPSVENIVAWRSLLTGELRLYSVAINGPRLAVRRDRAGALHVAGVPVGDARPREAGAFLAWLLAQHDIEIRDAEIEWRDELRGAPPLALSAVNVHLRGDGERHALGISARLPAELGEHFEARGEMVAAPAPGGWSGRVYAQVGYADLAQWRAWIALPAALLRGRGAARVWMEVENGAWRAATVDVAANDVALVLADDAPALELDSLRGRLAARALPDGGYQLGARQLTLAAPGGSAMGPIDFQAAWRPRGGTLSANVVELGSLARLAHALPLPVAARRLADELKPRGQLADLSYQWEGPVEAPAHFRARGRFVELGLQPWGRIPGFAGLAGTLQASESGGRVQLHSTKAEIELPAVFPQPRVALDALSGQIDWQQEGGRFSARFTSVHFENRDLSGSAFGAFTRSGDGPGAIDLSATLTRADAGRVARYLPLAAIMGDKARRWVAESVLAGRASDAHLVLRGNLADFPYADPGRGQFLVTARVHDGVLRFAQDWPRIDAIDAQLRFEGSGMEIIGRSGRILGAQLANVRVGIPDLGSHEARLSVHGEAAGSTAQFLEFIRSSPVHDMTAGFTDRMTASGQGRLRLALELPLAHLDASRVSGDYEFADNTLHLHERLPAIERAAGRLSFSEASFKASEVHGSVFGGPVAFSGGTLGEGTLDFTAQGEAAADALGELARPWERFLSGRLPYRARLSLRAGSSSLVLDSPLRGLASALPAPLGKGAEETVPLRVQVQTSDGGQRERVLASLGDRVAVDAVRARGGAGLELQRAAIWLGPLAGRTLRLPAKGISIQGSLAALDADHWRSALAPAGESGVPPALFLDVKLGKLRAYGKQFNDVVLRASTDQDGWSADVAAAEVHGKLNYRAARIGRLLARLTRFDVPADVPGASARALRPGELPVVDFVAERFSVHGKQLGRVELVGTPDGKDWRIDKLTIANPDATLHAKAWWRGGEKMRTVLDFALEARDAGAALGRVGYGGLVLGGTARLEGSASWDGEPASFDAASLSGELKLAAEDGQFLEIDPGLGKLVSLMSLQALPRRIALDFRDVFSKGFRFDRIDAASRVERGVMQVREFRMRGSAAEVEMSGTADLARETQDLRVRVVPGLGDSAATVIGIVSPVVGVSAAVAQHALSNPLGQIFARDFSVAGGWADPQVTRLNPPQRPKTSESP